MISALLMCMAVCVFILFHNVLLVQFHVSNIPFTLKKTRKLAHVHAAELWDNAKKKKEHC